MKSSNDSEAWEEFEAYYFDFIQMVLGKMNISASHREDLTQEILIKLWKSLKKHQYNSEKAKFRTWLSTVIRNTVIDSSKSMKAREAYEAKASELKIDKQSDLEFWIEEEWREHLYNKVLKHLQKFFSGQAIDIFMLDMDGLSTDQISEELSIKKNTVYVLRNRVKQKFMNELKHLRSVLEF